MKKIFLLFVTISLALLAVFAFAKLSIEHLGYEGTMNFGIVLVLIVLLGSIFIKRR